MERIPLFDRAKGLGMLLVVFGHLFQYGGLAFSIIFSFHMPLFFIISGMLYTVPSNTKLGSLIKSILIRYGTPFLFFSALGFVIKTLLFKKPDFNIVKLELFYLVGSDELMTGALWFIGLLAVAMLLMPALIDYGNKFRKNKLFLLVMLSLLSTVYGLLPVTLPFRARSISAVVLFVYIGYLLKKEVFCVLKNPLINKCYIYTIPLCLFLIYCNKTVNIAIPVFNNFFLFVICALHGTLGVLLLSQYKIPSIIEFLGKYSLIIFSVHGIWIAIFTRIINYFTKATYRPMDNMPIEIIFLEGFLVLFMSGISAIIIYPVYNTLYKKVSMLIKV